MAHRVASWSDIGVFTTSLITSDSESDYEDDGETGATGDADAEIPEEDDAASGAATEIVVSRDATASSPPEASQAEAHPEAPSTAAGAEEIVAAVPSAAASEKPASPSTLKTL